MHNKGIDIFLEALARADQNLAGTDASILVLCLVMGGHTGINPAAVSGDPSATDNGQPFICTHYASNAPQDPIINACRRLGLNNTCDKRVKVIFVPAMLDGNDGFFNMPYEDVISACDVGFFPSWYEPWGYTPQECAAWAVPTLTTDLSGFGMWARQFAQKESEPRPGVHVMPRRGTNFERARRPLHERVLQSRPRPGKIWPSGAKTPALWPSRLPGAISSLIISRPFSWRWRRPTRIDHSGNGRESLNRILTASSSATLFCGPSWPWPKCPKPWRVCATFPPISGGAGTTRPRPCSWPSIPCSPGANAGNPIRYLKKPIRTLSQLPHLQ